MMTHDLRFGPLKRSFQSMFLVFPPLSDGAFPTRPRKPIGHTSQGREQIDVKIYEPD